MRLKWKEVRRLCDCGEIVGLRKVADEWRQVQLFPGKAEILGMPDHYEIVGCHGITWHECKPKAL